METSIRLLLRGGVGSVVPARVQRCNARVCVTCRTLQGPALRRLPPSPQSRRRRFSLLCFAHSHCEPRRCRTFAWFTLTVRVDQVAKTQHTDTVFQQEQQDSVEGTDDLGTTNSTLAVSGRAIFGVFPSVVDAAEKQRSALRTRPRASAMMLRQCRPCHVVDGSDQCGFSLKLGPTSIVVVSLTLGPKKLPSRVHDWSRLATSLTWSQSGSCHHRNGGRHPLKVCGHTNIGLMWTWLHACVDIKGLVMFTRILCCIREPRG